jgi:hypothetical protein
VVVCAIRQRGGGVWVLARQVEVIGGRECVLGQIVGLEDLVAAVVAEDGHLAARVHDEVLHGGLGVGDDQRGAVDAGRVEGAGREVAVLVVADAAQDRRVVAECGQSGGDVAGAPATGLGLVGDRRLAVGRGQPVDRERHVPVDVPGTDHPCPGHTAHATPSHGRAEASPNSSRISVTMLSGGNWPRSVTMASM